MFSCVCPPVTLRLHPLVLKRYETKTLVKVIIPKNKQTKKNNRRILQLRESVTQTWKKFQVAQASLGEIFSQSKNLANNTSQNKGNVLDIQQNIYHFNFSD